ncbi:hypothetical protein [Flavobacterium sp. LS1P3]|uniref:hypothetical protein n=1 Tax=Flavobacterium sp. LS1P3 TaxID=3401720 RepID=UPI003AAD9554
MLNKSNLISEINKHCKILFTESSFILSPSSANRFKITGDNTSKAINNYNNSLEEINVIKWFGDFWIYIIIKFEDQNTFISLSVFQGLGNDNRKNQLFRAEWDDYNNASEKHPQPHWHITSNQAIENTFDEYANSFQEEGFMAILKEEKSKIIDVNRIHFAMNGNWINDEKDVHVLNNELKIVKWFQGLLAHIKVQLEYAK